MLKTLRISALLVSVTLAMPFILCWVYISQLAHGVHDAFHFAWVELRIELGAYTQLIRNATRGKLE